MDGTAREIREKSLLNPFAAVYKRKYDWNMSDSKDPIYEVQPRVVFGITENAEANPTRW